MGRGSYSKEFKLEAVRLLKEGNKPASELALELGVKTNVAVSVARSIAR